MSERYFSIIFPEELIKEPVVYSLVRYYNVATNIFRASISGGRGWMALGLSGEDDNIDRAIMDLRRRGAVVREGDRGLMEIKEQPSLNAIRVRLKVPPAEIEKPFISDTINSFDVVVNIRAANIEPTGAVIEMEISGALEAIDKAIEYIKKREITVDPIEGNVIE
ncbi:hypothetical protein MNBD_NITROSPINAE02-235 [hydrothermal vent metagenome]|uniref:NIL domain-containing protein n=1 Tax=hydrothermal vent metagenome TaxID=652676 RepID=A0A3B1C3T1_9ZZZZ